MNTATLRVPPDYLRKGDRARLAERFCGTGDMPTYLPRCPPVRPPVPTPGFAPSKHWAISTDFVPGVLSARFSREWTALRMGLKRLGVFAARDPRSHRRPFEALLDYLADDYELGRA